MCSDKLPAHSLLTCDVTELCNTWRYKTGCEGSCVHKNFCKMDELAQIYSVELKPLIIAAGYKLCTGCIINHGSQEQHDICVMMGWAEKVNYLLEEAVSMLDETSIQKQLDDRWGRVDLKKNDFSIIQGLLLKSECRSLLWQCANWKMKVMHLMT